MPDDFKTAAGNGDFANVINIGFPGGTKAGAAFAVDASKKDSVYFAEEKACDITNTVVESPEVIRSGDSVKCEAKLYNQIGIEGTLKQDFDWVILDEDRNPVPEGFSISKNGASVTVNVLDGVLGRYYIYTYSTEYPQMGKSVSIDVKKAIITDKELTEAGANIIKRPSSSSFAENSDPSLVLTQTNAKVNPEYYTIKAIDEIKDTKNGVEGLRIQNGYGGIRDGHSFNTGDKYVISAEIRSSGDEDAYFNFTLSNGNKESAIQSKKYSAQGMKATKEWQKFNAAFEISDNFDPKAEIFFIIGLADGCQKDASVDVKLNVYIAKESAVAAKISANAEADMDSEYILTASLVNIVGEEMESDTEFNWYLLGNDQGTEAEYASLESIDRNTARLKIDLEAESGTYYAVAEPKDIEGIRKVFEFTLNKPTAQECAIQILNRKDKSEIAGNFEKILDVFELEGVYKECDADETAKLIAEESESFSVDNAVSNLKKLAIMSLFNKNDSSQELYTPEGDFKYSDELGIKEFYNGNTLQTIFDEVMSDAAKEQLRKDMVNIESAEDFYQKFSESVILNAIALPDTRGSAYIGAVLTEENAKKADIDIINYLKLKDKTNANLSLAGKRFTHSSLESTIADFKDDEPGGGGFHGGSGGGKTSPVLPSVIQDNVVITPSKAEENESNFEDVPESHWAFDEIYHLKKLKKISGVDETHFAPEHNITRDQFVKMFIEALNIEEKSCELNFDDTEKGAWYDSYIQTAVANGLVNGISKSEFGVGKSITRQDICVIVVRALKIENDDTVTKFIDSDDVSEYAKGAVAYLSDFGVVNGFSDGSFRPKDSCTRAQAAKIICTLINLGGVK